jgi:dsDNA-specific endonuclease/ATPase MutS2
VLQARRALLESIDGIEPALSTDGAFELQAARHPLLKSPVPVTIKVIPAGDDAARSPGRTPAARPSR